MVLESNLHCCTRPHSERTCSIQESVARKIATHADAAWGLAAMGGLMLRRRGCGLTNDTSMSSHESIAPCATSQRLPFGAIAVRAHT
jgi:hypothetical protein